MRPPNRGSYGSRALRGSLVRLLRRQLRSPCEASWVSLSQMADNTRVNCWSDRGSGRTARCTFSHSNVLPGSKLTRDTPQGSAKSRLRQTESDVARAQQIADPPLPGSRGRPTRAEGWPEAGPPGRRGACDSRRVSGEETANLPAARACIEVVDPFERLSGGATLSATAKFHL